MSRTVSIRFARRTDAATIARMSRALVENGLAWRWRIGRVVATIDSPNTLCIVACDARENILGFSFVQYGESKAHLMLLAVSPRARRTGLGKALVDWHEVCCRNCGITALELEVRATNHVGRAFYDALGFGESELVRGYYDGREDALRMRLEMFG